jgi:hypothetical protein
MAKEPRLCIVGLSNISYREATVATADEVWCVNNAHDIYNLKPDLIVAMDDFERDLATHPEYVESIADSGYKVLSTEAKDKWPMVEPYPLQEVCEYLEEFISEPWLLLDNSCNYILALAMCREYRDIFVTGVDWCHPYKPIDLEISKLYFKEDGYRNFPDWFKYYNPSIMVPRRNGEPGSEAWHYLLGVAAATDISVTLEYTTTVLNKDRKRFFYGYQHQPEIHLASS